MRAAFLPAAVEVMSMASAPSWTPDWTAVRIHSRCRIDRIFFHHHGWRRYNDRPLNDDGGEPAPRQR